MMQLSSTPYKYFAFISYSSHDTRWGRRLQRRLEGYKMSATLCRQHGWQRKPMKPVFFAPTDIQPGGLTEELQGRLRDSRHLIVVCSPHSAQSKWVGEEIAYFHSLGRTKNIHFFIVEGTPRSGDSGTECFHPVIEKLGLPEILGANIHEKNYRLSWLNRERAYVQLVTKLLGIDFDDIWKRHRRRLLHVIVLWILGAMAVLSALVATWYLNRSVDISMAVTESSERNADLPAPEDAVVTLYLDNEVKVDTIKPFLEDAVFYNVPQYFLGKKVPLSVRCEAFLPVDTVMVLAQNPVLRLYRNPNFYGHIKARICKAPQYTPLSGCMIRINGTGVISDENGYISLQVPLAEQKTSYPVTASVPLETDTITMPCGNSDAIIVK